ILCPWPLRRWPVPVEFDTVAIGVAQVQCFADSMIRRPFQVNACFHQAPQSVGQVCSRRIHNGKVVKTCGTRWWRGPSSAFPRVQTDMMMIGSRGDECRLVAIALRFLETENVPVKRQRAVQVRDFEVDVAHSGLWSNRTELDVLFHNP